MVVNGGGATGDGGCGGCGGNGSGGRGGGDGGAGGGGWWWVEGPIYNNLHITVNVAAEKRNWRLFIHTCYCFLEEKNNVVLTFQI